MLDQQHRLSKNEVVAEVRAGSVSDSAAVVHEAAHARANNGKRFFPYLSICGL